MFGKSKEEIVLKIEGMHCMMCSAKVEKALKAMNGVSNVAVDLEAKTATVTHDPEKATKAAMQQVIAELGFQPVD